MITIKMPKFEVGDKCIYKYIDGGVYGTNKLASLPNEGAIVTIIEVQENGYMVEESTTFIYEGELEIALKPININDFYTKEVLDAYLKSAPKERHRVTPDGDIKGSEDDSKPRVSLIEPDYILEIARVLSYGAKKRGANNWKTTKPDDKYRWKDAMFRHLLAYLGGQEFDPDTGLHHLAHMSCNAMFLQYLDKQDESK